MSDKKSFQTIDYLGPNDEEILVALRKAKVENDGGDAYFNLAENLNFILLFDLHFTQNEATAVVQRRLVERSKIETIDYERNIKLSPFEVSYLGMPEAYAVCAISKTSSKIALYEALFGAEVKGNMLKDSGFESCTPLSIRAIVEGLRYLILTKNLLFEMEHKDKQLCTRKVFSSELAMRALALDTENERAFMFIVAQKKIFCCSVKLGQSNTKLFEIDYNNDAPSAYGNVCFLAYCNGRLAISDLPINRSVSVECGRISVYEVFHDKAKKKSVFCRDGTYRPSIPGNIGYATGIQIDAYGNVIVGDEKGHCLHIFSADLSPLAIVPVPNMNVTGFAITKLGCCVSSARKASVAVFVFEDLLKED